MRLTAMVVSLSWSLVALAAGAAAAKGPRPACKLLPPNIAEVYAEVSPEPILDGERSCAYSNATGTVTIALVVIGPLPVAIGKADYEGAFAEAQRTGTPERLHGFGPPRAFGLEGVDNDGNATATVTFLAGRWTGQMAITAPAAAGDATVDSLASLLKHHVWKRWR